MSIRNDYANAWETVPATIASGTSLSSAIDLGGLRVFSIAMPSAWTAASLSFQCSVDGGTSWFNLYDQSGTEVTAAAAASTCITLTPSQFAPIQYLRIRSGTAAAPVAQAADRQLQLVLRGV